MVFNLLKKYFYFVVVIILLFDISYTEPVTISGVVQDTTKSPIKKAEITLQNLRGAILAEEETDRKGLFKIKDIEPDYYYLIIKFQEEVIGKNGELSLKKNIERVKINIG